MDADQNSRDRLLEKAEVDPFGFAADTNNMLCFLMGDKRFANAKHGETIKDTFARNAGVFRADLQVSDTVSEALEKFLKSFNTDPKPKPVEGELVLPKKPNKYKVRVF